MIDRPPARPRPGGWQTATVLCVRSETPRAKTFRLALPAQSMHLPGQHYVVRLRAPDGYAAARSYSVATPPDGSSEIEITVELLDDGEVSGFLHEVVAPGDSLEVRGPIGGWFVWSGDAPALLVGGGSGIVPLMAMLRFARREGHGELVRLVVSVRTPDELYYSEELPGPETSIVYTRAVPAGWPRPAGRLRRSDLAGSILAGATAYVCGTPGFADTATELLSDLGLPVERIRVERFGPTR